MPTRELSLFADLDQGRLVQSYLSTLQAVLPRFVFGDSIPVSFRPLKSNGNNSVNPWREVDLTGKIVRIAIGSPAGAATSGTFALSYGGDTTAAIAYNADGAAIQTALNALASITAAGGVVVTRAGTGAFRIVWNTAGVRTAITASTESLYPSSGAEIRVAVEGSVSAREIVVARLEALPAAFAELSDEMPVAASEIVEIRTGSGTVGAILSLGFSVLPYSGSYSLEIGGEQTLGIPWDADASTLQAALELVSTVGAGKVIVSGEFPAFTLNFDVSLGDIGAMTIDMAGLVVPKGRVGSLDTNTAAMVELLNGAAQATAKLEIELYDIADDTTWTVLQTDCTVIDDVIGNTPSTTPAFPSVLSLIGAMTRTAAQGPPTNPQYLDVTAIGIGWSSYDPTGRIPFLEMEAGAPKYYRGGAHPKVTVFWDTGWFTSVTINDATGVQWFGDGGVIAAVLEYDWIPDSGGDFTPTGNLEMALGPQVEPAYIGQWCRVGDAAPFDWYQAETLTSWVNRTAWVIDLLATGGDGLGIHELCINSAGGTSGILNLYSDSGYRAQIYAPISYTANRTLEAPDIEGVLAVFGAVNTATPVTGNTVTVSRYQDRFYYLTPAGTLATLTLALSPSFDARDGQRVSVLSTQIITALTVSAGSGNTMGGTTLTTMAANTLYEFIYSATVSKWIRIK
jgi:hypothetical protein